jgi:hypothetical protein
MNDAPDGVFRPLPSAAEFVLKLGPEAQIIVDTDPEGHPILAIVDGAVTFLLMPYGASEGATVTKHDVQQSSELLLAAAAYREALYEARLRQQGDHDN